MVPVGKAQVTMTSAPVGPVCWWFNAACAWLECAASSVCSTAQKSASKTTWVMSLVLQYKCLDVNPDRSSSSNDTTATPRSSNNNSGSGGDGAGNAAQVVRVAELPWLVLLGIMDKLSVGDMVAFLSTEKRIREAFWHDDNFWQRQFVLRFGNFTPSCFHGSWRDAFATTYSLGTSYISEEATRSAIASVCYP